MQAFAQDVQQLIDEHHTLLRQYARTQAQCTALLAGQAAEIESLHAQAMRQRAALIVRDTALAWARQDHAMLEASAPGLSRRAALTRKVENLMGRIQELMRERLHRQSPHIHDTAAHATQDITEESLVAADLVICQTGCLSHGDYWRVQDHCKRTGKACVLVESPNALRIMRIHRRASPAPQAT
jgi:hypothetical protein